MLWDNVYQPVTTTHLIFSRSLCYYPKGNNLLIFIHNSKTFDTSWKLHFLWGQWRLVKVNVLSPSTILLVWRLRICSFHNSIIDLNIRDISIFFIGSNLQIVNEKLLYNKIRNLRFRTFIYQNIKNKSLIKCQVIMENMYICVFVLNKHSH